MKKDARDYLLPSPKKLTKLEEEFHMEFKVIYPDGKTVITDTQVSEKLLHESTERSGDQNLQFVAKIQL